VARRSAGHSAPGSRIKPKLGSGSGRRPRGRPVPIRRRLAVGGSTQHEAAALEEALCGGVPGPTSAGRFEGTGETRPRNYA